MRLTDFDDIGREPGEDGGIHSLDQLQALLESFVERHNRERVLELGGLSREELHSMLCRPFEATGDVVTINTDLDAELVRSAPIMQDLRVVVDYVAENDPVRATAKGFLGRAATQALHRALAKAPSDRTYVPRLEAESGLVHWFRLLLRDVGWLKLRKNAFSLTKAGLAIARDGITAQHYHTLLRHYCTRFNWGFRDRYHEIGIIQSGFLFALFLCRGDGDELRPLVELAERFLKALPTATEDIAPTPWRLPGQAFRAAFALRFGARFAEPFGLFELRPAGHTRALADDLSYRVTPLYRQYLRWSHRPV